MPLTALVVDDNPAIRTVLARSLERRGWEVKTAGDGLEAIEVVRAQSFDVVISDANTPRRGGLWLWQQALALRPELRGRFVVTSVMPLPDAWSVGPFADTEQFLLKPLSLTTLWGMVQRIVKPAEGDWSHSEVGEESSAQELGEEPIGPPRWPPEGIFGHRVRTR